MNQSPAAAPPTPAVSWPSQQKPSVFAWVSLVILGVLNCIAVTFAGPTLVLVALLAFGGDTGGMTIIGLPEFLYVPAQLVLFLPSLIIVIVAAVRKNLNLAYKLHLAVMVLSGIILLMNVVGLAIVIGAPRWR